MSTHIEYMNESEENNICFFQTIMMNFNFAATDSIWCFYSLEEEVFGK